MDGLDHEAVDSIISMYGSDDEESLSGALNKWHRKTNEQPQGPDGSYLDDVVNMAATPKYAGGMGGQYVCAR